MSAVSQRGGFVMGVVIGLLVGLALALGVALYITKAPVPFVNKVPQRTAEQDTAEAERNRTWDPNGPLGGKAGNRPAAAASSAVASASAPAAVAIAPPGAPPAAGNAPARDPAAILSGAPVPTAPQPPQAKAAQAFDYFVQAGAFGRTEEAEQQRAKLAMMGAMAKISERDQAGRVVYRVRLGPYPSREEADSQLARLQEQNIEAQIVRVEKP